MNSGGRRSRLASPAIPDAHSCSATTGITVYGCQPDEAALFHAVATQSGVSLTVTEEPVSEANAGLASGNRCISIGHRTRVSNAVLVALRAAGVEYVSTRSIGCNHVDVAYAESIGLRVGNVGYSPDSVADYTLMLMLMALRNSKATLRRTDAHDYRLPVLRGRELRDLTVGVVGTGRIGAAVIARLQGFGARVLACDSRTELSDVDYTSLDQLLWRGDIVTLHTPLTTQTRHLLSRKRIAEMKADAVVVNTARGQLVDTEALLEALENGHLSGAALDVLEGEEGTFYVDCRGRQVENPLLSRLQEMPNVIISPHSAYYTDRTLQEMVENSVTNCLSFAKENPA